MRPNPLLQLTLLLAVAACSAHHASAAVSSSSPSPAPLISCETRAEQIDGVDLILVANVDETLASVSVVRAPDDASRARALADVQHAYGDAHIDNRRMMRATKWGVVQQTDLCGHPVFPSPSPSN